jgi:hypothetical protein
MARARPTRHILQTIASERRLRTGAVAFVVAAVFAGCQPRPDANHKWIVFGPAGHATPPVPAAAAGPDAPPPTPARAVKARSPIGPAATVAPAPPVTLAPVPPATPLGRAGALPVGKGMWIWQPQYSDGGDVGRIVERARHVGLTHLYVRTGSSWMGFYAQGFLDQLLPVAHAAGIRVYGWDFPNLADWRIDADRSLAAIRYTTPAGHRIDGFAADIERQSEGTRLSPGAALAYGTALREGVGYGYPLIAVVPKLVSSETNYPYPHVVAQFDAIAPMVYWINREPGDDVAKTIQWLTKFGKPIMPVGQAYDPAVDGGPPGTPGRGHLHRFMGVAEQWGATGVSFWDWQHATQEHWDAIRDAPWFVLPSGPLKVEAHTRQLQTLLTSLGFTTPRHGVLDRPTIDALASYQRAAGLAPTGQLDQATMGRLFTPVPPPIRPLV